MTSPNAARPGTRDDQPAVEACPGRTVSDVCHHWSIWRVSPEIPVDQIIGQSNPITPDRGARAFTMADAKQSRRSHMSFDRLATATESLIRHSDMDARSAPGPSLTRRGFCRSVQTGDHRPSAVSARDVCAISGSADEATSVRPRLTAISTAPVCCVCFSIPMQVLRQTRRLGPPCLRALHSPSPSSLMAVLSAARHRVARQCPEIGRCTRPFARHYGQPVKSAHAR